MVVLYVGIYAGGGAEQSSSSTRSFEWHSASVVRAFKITNTNNSRSLRVFVPAPLADVAGAPGACFKAMAQRAGSQGRGASIVCCPLHRCWPARRARL